MNICANRLINQGLVSPQLTSAQQVVQHFGAVQAQEYLPTKWGMSLRMPTATNAGIEAEITSGNIVRTHVLRPTWHFVNAENIRWLLKLTGPRVHAINAYMYRQEELDNKIFSKCNSLIIKLLQNNNHFTRDEIGVELAKKKIFAEGFRLSYIMMQAELEGIVINGVMKGKKHTYALLEERIPKVKTISRQESLAKLTNMYFTSRGMATIYDFATWCGLTIADCKTGINLNKNSLNSIKNNDQDYYFSGSLVEKISDTLFLIPIYDEYIMGYKDRTALINPKFAGKKIAFLNMIIFNGKIIGSWKATSSTKSMTIEYSPFEQFTKTQQKLFDAQIEKLKLFHNASINLILRSQS